MKELNIQSWNVRIIVDKIFNTVLSECGKISTAIKTRCDTACSLRLLSAKSLFHFRPISNRPGIPLPTVSSGGIPMLSLEDIAGSNVLKHKRNSAADVTSPPFSTPTQSSTLPTRMPKPSGTVPARSQSMNQVSGLRQAHVAQVQYICITCLSVQF